MTMLSPQNSPNKHLFFMTMLVATASTGGTAVVPQMGYTSPNIRVTNAREGRAVHVAQLENVRTGLGISATMLCKAFGVSRQTYYNWLNGDRPSPDNQAMLGGLSAATDVLRDIPLAKSLLLAQPIERGLNFWHLIAAGEDPARLASILKERTERTGPARLAAREALERKRLAGTLKPVDDATIG